MSLLVSEYIELQKELLQLEREEEKKELLAAGEGAKLSQLEASGLAISRLFLASRSSDAGGRQVLHFVPTRGRQLILGRFTTGDIVGIREQTAQNPTVSANESQSVSFLEGVIIALDENGIQVACDEPIQDDDESHTLFVLIKVTSDVTHNRYMAALKTLEKASSDVSHVAHTIVRVLLYAETPRYLPAVSLTPKQENVLKNLNQSQREAVNVALRAKDLSVMHGPPGTGKTHTLIALIRAEVMRGSRVLVVAPSNVAVDNIAERLAHAQTSLRFLRAGHPARIIPSVIKYGMDQQLANTEEARLARDIRVELDNLEQKIGKSYNRGERKGLREEQRALRRELRRREDTAVKRLLSSFDVVLSTISGAGARILDTAEKVNPFDVVVIDEAAQAMEIACWVPLLRARKAVLAGDPFQLAGTVKSAEAENRGLKKSILDRVFTTESLKCTVMMLTRQYRMNRIISDWSSNEFYNGDLIPDPSVANRRVIDLDSCIPDEADDNITHPFIVVDTAGGDCEEDDLPGGGAEQSGKINPTALLNASRSNQGEATIVGEIIRHFTEAGLSVDDIGVISPYGGQVEVLRNLLWPTHGRGLEVSTVDSFQGREKEVICMSLVRSNEAGDVGFLSDDRRLNVAITRAKRCVVIVCDSETVCSNPLFKRMLEYTENYGLYVSAVVDFADIVGTFSHHRRPKEAIDAEQKSTSRVKPVKTTQRGTRGSARNGGSSPRNHSEGRFSLADQQQEQALRESFRKQLESFIQNDFVIEKEFSSELSSLERKLVHELAEEFGLNHQSRGMGNERRICISKGGAAVFSLEDEFEEAVAIEELESTFEGPKDDDNSANRSSGYDELIHTELPYEAVDFGSVAAVDDGENQDSSMQQKSNYSATNELLKGLRNAREDRATDDKAARPPHTKASKRRGKNKKGARPKPAEESDDDFDVVLAKYGAQASSSSSPSPYSKAVAEIVNGVLTAKVAPEPKRNTQAQRRLAAKISKAADQRKRKTKSPE